MQQTSTDRLSELTEEKQYTIATNYYNLNKKLQKRHSTTLQKIHKTLHSAFAKNREISTKQCNKQAKLYTAKPNTILDNKPSRQQHWVDN